MLLRQKYRSQHETVFEKVKKLFFNQISITVQGLTIEKLNKIRLKFEHKKAIFC